MEDGPDDAGLNGSPDDVGPAWLQTQNAAREIVQEPVNNGEWISRMEAPNPRERQRLHGQPRRLIAPPQGSGHWPRQSCRRPRRERLRLGSLVSVGILGRISRALNRALGSAEGTTKGVAGVNPALRHVEAAERQEFPPEEFPPEEQEESE